MVKISIDDVRRLLRECAGVDDSVDLNGDIGQVEFADLGYDSLAVLEVTARIQQEFGIKLSEDETHALTTPAKLVDYVNTWRVTA